MELLQFSSPEHVSSFVDLHPISMSRRYLNVTKTYEKKKKKEFVLVRMKCLEICISKDDLEIDLQMYRIYFLLKMNLFIGNNFSKVAVIFRSILRNNVSMMQLLSQRCTLYYILQKRSYKWNNTPFHSKPIR